MQIVVQMHFLAAGDHHTSHKNHESRKYYTPYYKHHPYYKPYYKHHANYKPHYKHHASTRYGVHCGAKLEQRGQGQALPEVRYRLSAMAMQRRSLVHLHSKLDGKEGSWQGAPFLGLNPAERQCAKGSLRSRCSSRALDRGTLIAGEFALWRTCVHSVHLFACRNRSSTSLAATAVDWRRGVFLSQIPFTPTPAGGTDSD